MQADNSARGLQRPQVRCAFVAGPDQSETWADRVLQQGWGRRGLLLLPGSTHPLAWPAKMRRTQASSQQPPVHPFRHCAPSAAHDNNTCMPRSTGVVVARHNIPRARPTQRHGEPERSGLL